MKFNRQHLEELTLQKIKEVNDEAGYRKYLEVPEMVEIVATIMEAKFKETYDDLVWEIKSLSESLDEAQLELEAHEIDEDME